MGAQGGLRFLMSEVTHCRKGAPLEERVAGVRPLQPLLVRDDLFQGSRFEVEGSKLRVEPCSGDRRSKDAIVQGGD